MRRPRRAVPLPRCTARDRAARRDDRARAPAARRDDRARRVALEGRGDWPGDGRPAMTRPLQSELLTRCMFVHYTVKYFPSRNVKAH